MKLTVDNIKVGLKVRCTYYSIPDRFGQTATIIEITDTRYGNVHFTVEWYDKTIYNCTWFIPDDVFDIIPSKHRKPKKVIPDIPIDTTLPLLMAGHLQDRQRKRF